MECCSDVTLAIDTKLVEEQAFIASVPLPPSKLCSLSVNTPFCLELSCGRLHRIRRPSLLSRSSDS